ncbi:MAG: alpha/beta fold hydrolase [Alphaproteobacteria bacterium]|nr:alpha/beta fold hydrolase [Alphaproteobacteria bacterium]
MMGAAARLAGLSLLLLVAWPVAAASLHDGGARRLGTKLTYEVEGGGIANRFVATILRAAPDVQFEWFTTSPLAADGVREISAAALASSMEHCGCHAHGEWGQRGNTTALWLSRAAYASLAGGAATQLSIDDGPGEGRPRAIALVRRDVFRLIIDGESAEVPALVARTDSDAELWIRDSADDPLVLAIAGEWRIRLHSIWQRRDDEIGRFVRVNGLGLHVVERGGGTPVFLLHGGPGMESNYFRPYVEPLERAFRLVYVDQPGQGLSQRLPPGTPYSIPAAVAAIEELRQSLGIDRFVLLGHSYGGFIAQLYALTHPGRLLGLILVDTAPSYEYNAEANLNIQRFGTAEQRRVLPGLSNDERIRRVFALYFDPPDQRLADAFLDRLILSAEAWRQLTATREFRAFDTRPRLGEIGVPSLIIAGENDLITTARQARILASGIRGARLHLFPNTGHNPFVEEPDAFNELVAAFVRGLSP